ncbi:MAG: hypothetical protein ACE5DW_04055, partial [Thermodesulfobacteriota bacterium]
RSWSSVAMRTRAVTWMPTVVSVRLCLNGSQSVHLTHGVPLQTPLGAYVFNGYVGAYAFPELPVIVDEDHFNFDVTAFNPANPVRHNSWRLLENGFRK